jgi:nicotinamide riboside kinase
LKIGISGTNSVGKTTLLDALSKLSQFKNYTIQDEVTRKVQKAGLDINEQGNSETQVAIMNSHIVNAIVYDDMLTDRTALDGYVYTFWLYKQSNVDVNALMYANKVMKKLIPLYDVIFYIAPEFDLVSDGVRSDSTKFRDEVAQLFEVVITVGNINVVRLTGSVEERVQQVLESING